MMAAREAEFAERFMWDARESQVSHGSEAEVLCAGDFSSQETFGISGDGVWIVTARGDTKDTWGRGQGCH